MYFRNRFTLHIVRIDFWWCSEPWYNDFDPRMSRIDFELVSYFPWRIPLTGFIIYPRVQSTLHLPCWTVMSCSPDDIFKFICAQLRVAYIKYYQFLMGNEPTNCTKKITNCFQVFFRSLDLDIVILHKVA